MKHLWYAWELARYRTGLFLASCLLQGIVFYLFPLVPGLIIAQIFNNLTDAAPISPGIAGLIALLVGTALARVMMIALGMRLETTLASWTDYRRVHCPGDTGAYVSSHYTHYLYPTPGGAHDC